MYMIWVQNEGLKIMTLSIEVTVGHRGDRPLVYCLAQKSVIWV